MKEKKLSEDGWRKLLKLIKKTHHLEELLHVLLTKEERTDLSKRILIIEALLKREETQRNISKHLKVSIAKITRGSNELKSISSTLKQFLDDEFL
jgi:TrpR family transcriptional regulator, trp operon repressor